MKATYVSVWDDDLQLESVCSFNPTAMRCYDIHEAAGAGLADQRSALTDEFVRLPDGTELRRKDGVVFDY